MRILALQLKRIGDLILTTPALSALRAAHPRAEIALAVAPGCASLLGAIDSISSGIVLGRGRGFAPWQQVLSGPWDLCFDFTGSDRSALAVAASRARERVTFSWVQRSKVRSLAYSRFVESPVRERHTVDHYLDLVGAETPREPHLKLPESARVAADEMLLGLEIARPFVLVHPGSARPEKYWLAERWAEVIRALKLPCILTCGPDSFERDHAARIQSATVFPDDLPTLAALIERAALVISCDTAAVHFAAAFARPQIALFGPTNPFHWRPRHDRALVLSAAHPGEPLRDFRPKMKGAPMECISTAAVIRATNALLAAEDARELPRNGPEKSIP